MNYNQALDTAVSGRPVRRPHWPKGTTLRYVLDPHWQLMLVCGAGVKYVYKANNPDIHAADWVVE